MHESIKLCRVVSRYYFDRVSTEGLIEIKTILVYIVSPILILRRLYIHVYSSKTRQINSYSRGVAKHDIP